MNTIQRRVAAGLLVLGAAAGLSGTALAAEKVDEHNVRFEGVMTGVDSPCTPEFDDITVNATWHSVYKMWQYDNGEWRSQSHFRTQLSGTAADGTGYAGSDQFQAHTRAEDGVAYITADQKTLLIGQGSAPNFALRYKVKVSFDLNGPNSTFEVVKDVAECRG